MDPQSWLPGGKKSLDTLWQEYKSLPIPALSRPITGSKRPRSPDPFERAWDMTLLYEDEEDELDTWLSGKCFSLDENDTLPQYWLRQRKLPSVYRLAQMGLDMASIPAMSSDCERVFSQGKLLITGQRNRLKADIIEATQCLRMWLILNRKVMGKCTGRGNWVIPFALYTISE